MLINFTVPKLITTATLLMIVSATSALAQELPEATENEDPFVELKKQRKDKLSAKGKSPYGPIKGRKRGLPC